MSYEFIDGREAAKILGLTHYRSLNRYRDRSFEDGGFIEGVHWQKLPSGVVYNKQLLENYVITRHEPELHLLSVQQYQQWFERQMQPSGKRKAS